MPIQSRDHQLWLLWGRGSLTLAEAPLLVEVICDTKLLRWRFRRFMLVNPLCSISCGSRRCRQLFCFQEAVVSSESSQAKLLNALRGRRGWHAKQVPITAPESWPLKIYNSVISRSIQPPERHRWPRLSTLQSFPISASPAALSLPLVRSFSSGTKHCRFLWFPMASYRH
jgi:hypothetical protein